MGRVKAVLILDPRRRAEQMAFVLERTEILYEAGDQLWVAITEEQAARFAEHGLIVQLHPEADWVEVPAGAFDPIVAVPEPPVEIRAPEAQAGVEAWYIVQFI